MKLSTIINAAREAEGISADACIYLLRCPYDQNVCKRAHRKHTQANHLFARAIQLADEQDELIVAQAQLLEQFATAMEEAHR